MSSRSRPVTPAPRPSKIQRLSGPRFQSTSYPSQRRSSVSPSASQPSASQDTPIMEVDAHGDDRSPEELRLMAQVEMLERMSSHLKDDNVNLHVQTKTLQAELNASKREKASLEIRLESGNQEVQQLKEARDRAFQAWHDEDTTLPSLLELPLQEEEDLDRVPLPSLRRISLEPSARASNISEVEQADPNADDSSALSTPRLPSATPSRVKSPIVKSEPAKDSRIDTQTPEAAAHSAPKTKRARRGVMSLGIRAPKRKNPDNYTDNPPTPFGQRRSKRSRGPISYEEEEFENAAEIAREVWRDSEPRSSETRSSVRRDLEDSDFEDAPDETPRTSPERSHAPSPTPSANPYKTKRRYKDRPTCEKPRFAKGTDFQVDFRFCWKPSKVRDLYTEWYIGSNGNPPIDKLETHYGPKWRNSPEKDHNGFANDWVSKRRRVIKALDHFAGKQGKDPWKLADEWDGVVQGRITQLITLLPAPTNFEREKEVMKDPLVYFSALPKKKKKGGPRKNG